MDRRLQMASCTVHSCTTRAAISSCRVDVSRERAVLNRRITDAISVRAARPTGATRRRIPTTHRHHRIGTLASTDFSVVPLDEDRRSSGLRRFSAARRAAASLGTRSANYRRPTSTALPRSQLSLQEDAAGGGSDAMRRGASGGGRALQSDFRIRKLHKRLHTRRKLELVQVPPTGKSVDFRRSISGAFAEPSSGLEPETPPYHAPPVATHRNPRQPSSLCFRRFRRLPIRHRLPLIATARLAKRSIPWPVSRLFRCPVWRGSGWAVTKRLDAASPGRVRLHGRAVGAEVDLRRVSLKLERMNAP
jgi:hypothetical protein